MKKKELFWGVKLVSELGLSFALPLVAGAFLGSYLDKYFYSSPKLTLSFILTGLFLGLFVMYKVVRDSIDKI